MSLENDYELRAVKTTDASVEFGRILASPSRGHEVVISGISGKFPNCDNIQQFKENLFNKTDMVSSEHKRWDIIDPDVPSRMGNLLGIDKFDAGYFGIHHRQATSMDPMIRLILERVVEAIFDAGLNPSDLKGSETGVFAGAWLRENEQLRNQEKLHAQQFAITGSERSMLARRISYFLKLKGPSFACDTSCSTSLYCLQHAYTALRMGQCDQAIVCSANLILLPFYTQQFGRLGLLSKDGKCKSFDDNADGFVRAEAIIAMFLQKSKDSKRIYATVVHAKGNSDGFKDAGILFPSRELQTQLLKEFYQECQWVKASDISFLEGHVTGTRAGDPEEVNTIEDALLKQRSSPLLVGSVKSNMGHAESAASLCSVAKAIIAFETNIIPPNLHYNTPRGGLKVLKDGRLIVVTEKTPLPGQSGLIGVNGWGFGGSNAHVLLKQFTKPKRSAKMLKEGELLLVCVSGRTKESVTALLDDVIANGIDREQIALLYNIFKTNVDGHLYRGFSLVSKLGETLRSISFTRSRKTPIVFVFTGLQNLSHESLHQLIHIPCASDTIQRISGYTKDNECFGSISNDISINLPIIDVLKEVKIEPQKIIDRSIGALASSYFRNDITLEEALDYVVKNNSFKSKQLRPLVAQTSKNEELASFIRQIKQRGEVSGTLIIEVGNHNICEALQKGMDFTNCSFMQITGMTELFSAIGRMYELGHNVQLQNLFPKVKFPVSRGTPMISPAIKWDHTRNWFVMRQVPNEHKLEEKTYRIMLRDSSYKFLEGHQINGRIVLPAASYLQLAWEILAQLCGTPMSEMNVVFENCQFNSISEVPEEEPMLILKGMLLKSGYFEIFENMRPVVTGRICIHLSEANSTELAANLDRFFDGPLMTNKQIYRELKMRDYGFKGEFAKLENCDVGIEVAETTWNNDWVSFISNMLQLRLLQEENRMPKIPEYIETLTVCGKNHLDYISTIGNRIKVHAPKDSALIKSGGVEIRGVRLRSVPSRTVQSQKSILQKYSFVSHFAHLCRTQAVLVTLQIVIENSENIRPLVAVEITLTDDDNDVDLKSIRELICNLLVDQRGIQPDVIVLSEKKLNAKMALKKNSTQNYNLVFGSEILSKFQILQPVLKLFNQNVFFISRERLEFDKSSCDAQYVDIIASFKTELENLVLFRKSTTADPVAVIELSNIRQFEWSPKLEKTLKKDGNLLLYSQNDVVGVIGLTKYLRHNYSGQNIRCVCVVGTKLHHNQALVLEQLQKNLVINVYKNDQWGTYRYLNLDSSHTASEHCYMEQLQRGDLNSMCWIEGPLNDSRLSKCNPNIIKVHFASINFRDLLDAGMKTVMDANFGNGIRTNTPVFWEYSGITMKGERVMGFKNGGNISTIIKPHDYFKWPVPRTWDLKDATTIPVQYVTCLYSFMVANLTRNKSILVHSENTGIKLAAVHLALRIGCTVFTTARSQQERDSLISRFPLLLDNHLMDSNHLNFEMQMMKATSSKGVNCVLNSLSGTKRIASIRCLAKGGVFLDTTEQESSNSLSLALFRKQASYHGIFPNQLFKIPDKEKIKLRKAFQELLDEGEVVHQQHNVVEIDKVESALQFIESKEFDEKLVVRISEVNASKEKSPFGMKIPCLSRYYCDGDKSYIICDRRDYVGLELADWLISRGCRKLILAHQTCVGIAYLAYRTKFWKKYGCTVETFSLECDEYDISTFQGCENLVNRANKLGPVQAIFHLTTGATCLEKDQELDEPVRSIFNSKFSSKVRATECFDIVSRKLCPELRDFVVFSSMVSGSKPCFFEMVNYIVEEICEKRLAQGFPALVIRSDEPTEIEMGSFTNVTQAENGICLKVLDQLLRQIDTAIVSSTKLTAGNANGRETDSILKAVADVIGLKDLRTVSLQASFAELGVDSITALEVQQILEKYYSINLSVQEIHSMTLARLPEIPISNIEIDSKGSSSKSEAVMKMVLEVIGSQQPPAAPIVHIESKAVNKVNLPSVILFPGIEGAVSVLSPLYNNLEASFVGIQYCSHDQPDIIEKMASKFLPFVERWMSQPFKIICYSFGVIVALALANILETKGYCGSIVCIDGAPDQVRAIVNMLDLSSEQRFQNRFLNHMKMNPKISLSLEEQRIYASAVYKRYLAILRFEPIFKLHSLVTLLKPTQRILNIQKEDYGLSNVCRNKVVIKVFEGTHETILKNQKLWQFVATTLNI
ncbi:fatty acid synthase-like isoform X2 [Cylas formicarius]|uniref:fatty acid synthase-like isoform X2 n=1 Tax=Cylas formicarius TaxID=197179 RepID=UPI0029587179|nr:fatty acid synthase-like isoform X2 [Cylas formicarius]